MTISITPYSGVFVEGVNVLTFTVAPGDRAFVEAYFDGATGVALAPATCAAGTYFSDTCSGLAGCAPCAPALGSACDPGAGATPNWYVCDGAGFSGGFTDMVSAAGTPCAAGTYAANASACAACAAAPGSFCGEGTAVAGGAPCAPGWACAGGAASPVRCVDTTHVSGGACVACVSGAGSFCGAAYVTAWVGGFGNPTGVAVDGSGIVFVADYGAHLIRKMNGTTVSTFAGSGSPAWADGVGVAASFHTPNNVAVINCTIIVADNSNHRVRSISPTRAVSTLAGSGASTFANGVGTSAAFHHPTGVAVAASGNVLVADQGTHRIRSITPTGVVSTLAGSGAANFVNGAGTNAAFNLPMAIAAGLNDIVVADFGNHRVRHITPTGTVTTLAGCSVAAFANGAGTYAAFYQPRGIAIDGGGNVYVADTGNNALRAITPAGMVTTLWAGYGTDGPSPSSVGNPQGIAVTASGVIYAASPTMNVIRVLTPAAPGCTPARYVRIDTPGQLNFGEIKVYAAGVNVALGKTATMSSVFPESISYCGDLFVSPVASFAVDGNPCSFANSGNGAPQWWEVDLGGAFTVTSLEYFSRNDDVWPPYYFTSVMNSAVVTFKDASNAPVYTARLPSVNVETWTIPYCSAGVPETVTATSSSTPTATALAMATATGSATGSSTASATASPTGSATLTATTSPSATGSATASATSSAALTATATSTATRSSTASATGSSTLSGSATASSTASATAAASALPVPSVTPLLVLSGSAASLAAAGCTFNGSGSVSHVPDHAGVTGAAVSFTSPRGAACPVAGLPAGAAPRTVTAWVQCPAGQVINVYSTCGFFAMISWGAAEATTGVRSSVGSRSDFFCFVGNFADQTSSTTVCDDAWHFVVQTYDGATNKLYVDGVLAFSGALALNTAASTALFLSYNGQTANCGGEYSTTALSDVRVYGAVHLICPAGAFPSAGACQPCMAGAFCPFASANVTLCPAGTFSVAVGATSNATCAECPAGSYAAAAGATACVAHDAILWDNCAAIRTVNITLPAALYLNIGELVVFNGTYQNVALKKLTSQSSTYISATNYCGGAQPPGLEHSSYVVDGNLCTFSSTLQRGGEWWEVDLGTAQFVNTVVLYNRKDNINGVAPLPHQRRHHFIRRREQRRRRDRHDPAHRAAHVRNRLLRGVPRHVLLRVGQPRRVPRGRLLPDLVRQPDAVSRQHLLHGARRVDCGDLRAVHRRHLFRPGRDRLRLRAGHLRRPPRVRPLPARPLLRGRLDDVRDITAVREGELLPRRQRRADGLPAGRGGRRGVRA